MPIIHGYHLMPMELTEALIPVSANTEGWGSIACAEGEEAPEFDAEYPYRSAVINLAVSATCTFAAWSDAGSVFIKWTKDGEGFSSEPRISVLLQESADFVAVFEEGIK